MRDDNQKPQDCYIVQKQKEPRYWDGHGWTQYVFDAVRYKTRDEAERVAQMNSHSKQLAIAMRARF